MRIEGRCLRMDPSAHRRGFAAATLLLLAIGATGTLAQKMVPPTTAAPKAADVRPAPVAPSTPEAGAAKPCAECGVVRSVRFVDKKPRGMNPNPGPVPRSPGGATGGPGGANSGGGAVKNLNRTPFWVVSVRMDGGLTRNYTYVDKPDFDEGDRVRTQSDGHRLAKATD